MTLSVLMTGATSQLGVFALPRLVEAGLRVIAISRNGKPPHWPSFEEVEWLPAEQLQSAAEQCQYFLSAGPMEVASEVLASGARFDAVIVFSSSSVVSKRESGDPDEQGQMQRMLALEAAMGMIAGDKGIRLTIFKPTLIYGCGLDNNVSLLAAWIDRFGFMPLNGSARGLRQPVHADDLAAAAVKALLSETSLPRSLFLAGGETLTYREMTRRVFAAMGKPARLISIPQWLFIFLLGLAGKIKRDFDLNPEMIRRQRVDLVFDDQQARDLLGYSPRDFRPGKADFSLPKTSRA